MGGLVTECLSWRGGLSLSVAHGGCHRVSLMGGFVTECGENIDRAQLDTTLDDVHSAGMDWNLPENILCLISEYCLKILK